MVHDIVWGRPKPARCISLSALTFFILILRAAVVTSLRSFSVANGQQHICARATAGSSSGNSSRGRGGGAAACSSSSSSAKMASSALSYEKVKDWVKSEYEDEQKFKANMGLLRALALFGGAVFVMRNYGEFLSI